MSYKQRNLRLDGLSLMIIIGYLKQCEYPSILLLFRCKLKKYEIQLKTVTTLLPSENSNIKVGAVYDDLVISNVDDQPESKQNLI